MALVRSSSRGGEIRYVLPVLWMMSYFSNVPMMRHVYFKAAIKSDKHNGRDSNQILLNNQLTAAK